MKVGDVVRLKDGVGRDNPMWVALGGWLYTVEAIRPYSLHPVAVRSISSNAVFIFYFDELEACDEGR